MRMVEKLPILLFIVFLGLTLSFIFPSYAEAQMCGDAMAATYDRAECIYWMGQEYVCDWTTIAYYPTCTFTGVNCYYLQYGNETCFLSNYNAYGAQSCSIVGGSTVQSFCASPTSPPSGDPTNTPIPPPPPGVPSDVMGRVATFGGGGVCGSEPYYKPGSCAVAPCPGISCVQENSMYINCNGRILDAIAGWDCNGCGAFYGTGGFNEGDFVSCTLFGLPAGFQCADPSSCNRSGILGPVGTNHWWFYIEPIPAYECSIDLPDAGYTISVGSSILSVPVQYPTPASASIDEMTFQINAPQNIADVCESAIATCPANSETYLDNSPPVLNARLTGETPGSTTITVSGTMVDEGNTACTPDTTNITVTNLPAWWQANEGDVMSEGNIDSNIPITATEDLLITGSDGLPIAAGGVSWVSGSGPNASNVYVESSNTAIGMLQFDDFRNKLPSNVDPVDVSSLATCGFGSCLLRQGRLANGGTQWPAGSGYYYYEYDGSRGDLTITRANPININVNDANRKIILFIENADLLINQDVQLTDGTGGFYVFTDGNIVLDESVTSLEGVFFAEGDFSTGTDGSDEILNFRGSIVAGSITLQRYLPNNALNPGEIFEYAPDLIMNYPPILGEKSIQWREVAP